MHKISTPCVNETSETNLCRQGTSQKIFWEPWTRIVLLPPQNRQIIYLFWRHRLSPYLAKLVETRIYFRICRTLCKCSVWGSTIRSQIQERAERISPLSANAHHTAKASDRKACRGNRKINNNTCSLTQTKLGWPLEQSHSSGVQKAFASVSF